MKKAFGQTVRDLKRGVNKKVLKESGIKQKVLDATSNESWGPHGSLLAEIAHASRNYHEYQLTMGVLWKRLTDTGKNWRHVYKALIVLEYLVGHGSERAIDEIKERTYQISILADFQYVDSSGKDQGSNVRKKSQSLVALVNDKERISEIREKASANRDKYRNEGRYGDKDDGRSSYGGEREYCYKDDDKNSRDGDRYSRDSDSNMDDEQRGRRKSVDNNENGSRGRSSDRERSFEDDGHSSSRDSGARADDYSRAAPPSYEEAVNESQSPVYSERDGGETPQVIASEDVDPLSAESINVDNQNTSFVNETPPQKVKAFDEFDPRGSFPVGVSAPVHSPQTVVSTASPTSNNAEMDLLGSLSDVFSPNSMAIVTSDSTNVETNIQTNTGPPSSFSTSQSSTQPFDDPFGDSPFKAITSADTYPSEHQSFGDSFQPTPPTSNPENDHNIRCGEAYYAVSNPELNIQNMQAFTDSSTFPQEEFDTSHSEIDILAGILPPSGPPDSQSPQPNSAMSTLQFPPNGNMYESFHSQAESTNPNMSGHTPFGQASKQYNMPGQSHFGQTSQQHNMPRQTTFDQASEPHNMAGQTPFGQTSEQYNMSGQTSFGQASQQHNMLGQTPFGQTTQQHNMSRQISFGQASQQHNMSGHTPFGQASQQENISGQILSGQVSQQHNMSRQNSFDQTSQQHNMLHTPFVHASQQHNMSQIPFGHASQQYNMSSPSQNSSGDVQFKNEGFMQQPQQRTPGLSSHPTNESSLNQPDSATSSGSQTPHFTTPNGHFDGGKPITQQAHGLSQQVHGIPSHTPQRAQSEPVGAYEYNNNGDVQFNNGGFTQQPIQYTSGLSSHSRSETFPNQPGFATSSDSQTPHSTTPNALGGQSEGGNYVVQQAHGASQQVYGVPSHSPHRTKSGPVTSHNNNNNVTGDMFAQTGVGSLGTSASQPSLTPLTGAIEIVSQTQTQKKFEPKSTIWADTLSRGLVNFNISGPKTNPLADIGVDFAAINRKEKRLEKSTAAQQQQVTSTINMGKAMGSGTGLGRAGASAMRPPPNSMVGSSMPMPMGMNVGGYGGMNQNHPMGMNQNNSMGMGMNMNQNHMMGMGMGMNMNQNQHPMGMSMNINQNQHSMGMGDMNMGGYGQGYSMQPQQGMLMASGPQPGMNNTYNPMMGQGGYNPQQQQPYGRGYQ